MIPDHLVAAQAAARRSTLLAEAHAYRLVRQARRSRRQTRDAAHRHLTATDNHDHDELGGSSL
jgi:hypothetical protein